MNFKEVLEHDRLKDNPVLHGLGILQMVNATICGVIADASARLDALWAKTGRDFTWAESLAGVIAKSAI